jgi:hypothetical protein
MEYVTLDHALAAEVPDIASPVSNGDGLFLMKYYNPGRIITRCAQHDYVFITQANICASWVEEAHVGCILNKRGGCCGQKRPGIFTYANAADARRWTNRGGR